jgi:GntR family galactonate operon transcriptional repressor
MTDGMPDAAGLRSWPQRPQRLATAVIEDLVDRLISGELPTDAPLPTEPVLCRTFAVSRTVIREAVKAMEAMRLVSVQQGQGTRIRPLGEWDLLNPVVLAAVVRHDAELAILDDLIDSRRALEAQMAAQAATRATPEQRAGISARMATLAAEVDDPTRYLHADVAFHDEIMAASGNRLARSIIHTLTIEAYRSMRYIGDPTPDECRLSNVAHQAVHDAVVAGDPERAAATMNEHILGSWHRRRPQPAQVAMARSRPAPR